MVVSSSPDEVDDLDLVTVRQGVYWIALARDDFPVHFDGYTALIELQVAEQVSEGHAVGERVWFTVDGHAHARRIVAGSYLYNLGTIW